MIGWWHFAACRGRPTQWWYPSQGDIVQGLVAKAVCSRCSVRVACLEAALAEERLVGHPYLFGIRGGLYAEERRRVLAAEPVRSVELEVEHVAPPVEVVPTGLRVSPRRRYGVPVA